MACRSRNKAAETMEEIIKSDPKADLEFLAYDASSLEAVHQSGKTFLRRNLQLDAVLLNAGAITNAPESSRDGLEWMFAINHLAHFVLLVTILPAIERAAKENGDVRISTTTSAGFRMHPDPASLRIGDAELRLDNSSFWWKETMPMYGRSKTCNILFASELSRRLRNLDWGQGVKSNAVHPGTVSTGFNRSVRSSWYVWTLEMLVYAIASVSRLLLVSWPGHVYS